MFSTSTRANNSSNISGGVLVNWGKINLEKSVFRHNSSRNNAGAIINGGKFNINDSEFDNNLAGYSGGAILNDGDMNIDNSSFNDNEAKMPGNSIYAIRGNLVLSNIEFSNNEENEIYSEQTADIVIKNCSFRNWK